MMPGPPARALRRVRDAVAVCVCVCVCVSTRGAGPARGFGGVRSEDDVANKTLSTLKLTLNL